MRTKLRFLVLLCLQLMALSTRAESLTGNELLEQLRRNDISALQYVAGITDAASITKHFFDVNPGGLQTQIAESGSTGLSQLWGCAPVKATYGQIADVTVKYLENRPRIRHLSAALIIAFAMKDAWPCPVTPK